MASRAARNTMTRRYISSRIFGSPTLSNITANSIFVDGKNNSSQSSNEARCLSTERNLNKPWEKERKANFFDEVGRSWEKAWGRGNQRAVRSIQ